LALITAEFSWRISGRLWRQQPVGPSVWGHPLGYLVAVMTVAVVVEEGLMLVEIAVVA